MEPMAAGPIVFLPTPVATTSQAADAEASFSAVASTTDQNFALIDDWIKFGKAWPTVFGSALAAKKNLADGEATSWTQFGSASWPAFDVVVPQGVVSLWIVVSGDVATTPGRTNHIAVALEVTGTGITEAVANEKTLVGGWSGRYSTGRLYSVPAASLVPGGTVTLTPVYKMDSSDRPAAGTIHRGEAWGICFT